MDIKASKDLISTLLTTDFEKELLDSCFENLLDESNKLRFNNFAYSIRELTRHVLERFSPDENVRKCIWFKPDDTSKPRSITRKQRIKYSIQGGLTDDYINDILKIDIETIATLIINSINSLSKYTHINLPTFNIPKGEVEILSEDVLKSVLLFFKSISDCRDKIIHRLEELIDKEIIDNLFYDTVASLDVLATHHFIDYFSTDSIDIKEINDSEIHIIASGIVNVKLQWGSDSDLRNDEGFETEKSFPFKCELFGKVNQIEKFITEKQSFEVDTDDYYE